jgi:hypothetical protein
MSANAVTTQPQKINVVPLTGLNSRNTVVFAVSTPRTEKRGSIIGGKLAIFIERRPTGQ